MTDQQTKAPSSTRHIRTIGFLPLLAIFYGYTAGGPFGYEDIFSQSGPGMALVFLTFVPFFWSIPMSFASAELNSILPVQGGFYRWTRAAFGDFWGFQCGWWNWTGTFLLNSLYGVLVMDYLVHYFPGLRGNAKWAGACLVLCLLSYLNIRGIQVSGWLSVAMLVAILIPVVWLCAAGTTTHCCLGLLRANHSVQSSAWGSLSPCGTMQVTSNCRALRPKCAIRKKRFRASCSGTRR